MSTGKKTKGNAARKTGQKTRPGGPKTSSGSSHNQKAAQTKATPAVTLTYDQIAQRAEHLWRQSGCLPGRDEQNWQEAEAQLRAEQGVK